MVGNKCDLDEDRQVNKEVAKNFARENNLLFLETSAKNGTNIEKIFQILSDQILTKIETGLIDPEVELGIKRGKEKKDPEQDSTKNLENVQNSTDQNGCKC